MLDNKRKKTGSGRKMSAVLLAWAGTGKVWYLPKKWVCVSLKDLRHTACDAP